MKLKFIAGEGYQVKIKDDSLDFCTICKCIIEDDDVFYICEDSKLPYCRECNFKAPCQKVRGLIPMSVLFSGGCTHKKIIGKVKL